MIQSISVLLGTGLSIFFLIRGYIPIHAGALECNGKAISFSGWSGVGKSTLIRYALEQGYPLITEDTLLVKGAEDLTVFPTIGIKSKLNDGAINYFNIDKKYIGTRINKTQKRWISIPMEQRSLEPTKLKDLYFLEPDDSLSEVKIESLDFWEKKKRLLNNINSLNNLPMKYTVKILKQVDLFAENVNAYRIKYPKNFEILEDIVNITLKEKGE